MAQLRPTLSPASQQPQPPTPQLARPQTVATVRMFTGWTIALLVILRIFIGWHFFIEGVYKLCQPDWRATSYLVASAGPFREYFRMFVKDVDGREALAINDPAIREGGELDGRKAAALSKSLEESLTARLKEMYDRIVDFYGLDNDQRKEAEKLRDAKKAELDLLAHDKDFVAQVWDYKVLLDEIARQEKVADRTILTFERERLQDMYNRKARIRAGLVTRVDKIITSLPTAVYKAKHTVTDDKGAPVEKALLSEPQWSKGFMKTDFSPSWFSDFSNKWALTIVGVCLILGLFTRLACLGAAGLLAMYYFAMPPLPGVPEGPSEGHYLVINKNLIELVTVLMLATTRVGRWGGLDGLIASKAKPAV
ncbi:MAG: DoxX family protein [Phycisphaerae bacterium]|nr:DoxX family protein [Phycisphaerae bacterium]